MIALGYMERSEALSLAGYGEHENYLTWLRTVIGEPTTVIWSGYRATGIAVTVRFKFCRLLWAKKLPKIREIEKEPATAEKQ